MPSDPPLPAATTQRLDLILAATVLLSAWLLFQVEPMAAKRILPWFGGGPAVWTTAMLFFQAALLGGYVYAHGSARWLRPRAQASLHAALILATVVLLAVNGVIAGDSWKPSGSEHARLQILVILSATVGLPYVLLSATAPLVQSWWGRTHEARSPYRLYALSNFGSLAALVSYPLAVEPVLGLGVQGRAWSILFLAFAGLCIAGGWAASSRDHSSRQDVTTTRKPAGERNAKSALQKPPAADAAPTMLDRFYWLALPACASVMLLAVTNYLCQDVASIPLLWVAPLATYLITFILAFDSDRWYRRPLWLAALVTLSYAACLTWRQGAVWPLAWQVGLHLAVLLAVGMVCHGEVARLRPRGSHLTSYYVHLAAGGAIGGLFVAVVAPLSFVDYYELPLGMLTAWGLAMSVLATDRQSPLYRGAKFGAWVLLVALWTGLATMAADQFFGLRTPLVASARNFFGVLKVQELEVEPGGAKYRRLLHGPISHGSQFVETSRRLEPTTYYGKASGVGQLLSNRRGGKARRVGIIGLGAGTLATYAGPGDEFRYYDIDPHVIEFADKYFTYVADARDRGAHVSVVEEDARLALEREPPQQFDVLVLDAFSGDAIPVHLLTVEAFELYLRHLRQPDGVLAVHISNRYLDLAPVVKAAADQFGLDATIVRSPADRVRLIEPAIWVLLYPASHGGGDASIGEPLVLSQNKSGPILWTDDHSSLLDVVIWK
jgi:hypothetical protein